MVYLDTSFSYRGGPYISTMPNSNGVFVTIETLKFYPMDEDTSIEFGDIVLESEEVWLRIVNYFRGELKSNTPIQQRVELLTDKSDIYSPIIKDREIKFRVPVAEEDDKTIVITIRHMTNFNIIDFAVSCLPKPIEEVNKSELRLLQETTTRQKLHEFEGRTWLLANQGIKLLPTNIKLIFSQHSSYEESIHLIGLLKPKSVYLFIESRQIWLNGFIMG